MALPRLAKGEWVSGAERVNLRAQLKERHDNGASIRELADEINRSYGFTRRLLKEAGAVLDRQGFLPPLSGVERATNAQRAASRKAQNAAERERLARDLKRLHDAGTSQRKLAAMIGRPRGYVRDLLREASDHGNEKETQPVKGRHFNGTR